MEIYNQVIFKSRYARYREDLKRREEWQETVDRYVDNVVAPVITDKTTIEELRTAISNLDVVPSMRALMTAGKALDRDNVADRKSTRLNSSHT